MSASKLRARGSYGDIRLYSADSGGGRCDLDLSDNTNLWGAPPAALRVIRQIAGSAVTRYPLPYAGDLRVELAKYAGVSPDMIVTGCGSDDVLDASIRAFSEPGDALAHQDPTFSMIPVFARMNGVTPVAVPLTDTFDIDPEALLATKARITYICSPNNPTSVALSRDGVEKVVDGAAGLVIIDEAYSEFAGTTLVALVASGRVIVTRTLSKAFGLAGLRVGYGIGAPEIISEIAKARGPYKVGGVAELAATIALTHDRNWMLDGVQKSVANRERFVGELEQLGFSPLKSSSNFVLVPVKDCAAAAKALADKGIAVRPFQNLPGVGDAIRITIAPWSMMDRCLVALDWYRARSK